VKDHAIRRIIRDRTRGGMARRKIRIAVLFGGRSGEHEVSLRSALTVISAMDPQRYEIVPIGIAHDGRWLLQSDAVTLLEAATPTLQPLGRGGIAVSLAPHPDGGALMPAVNQAPEDSSAALARPLDVVFPILHGTYGEDGTVQGLLELTGIPYVGAGVLGSALGMDKDAQKRILRDGGLPVVNYFALSAAGHADHPRRALTLAGELGYPVFVKPNALGSSIGISKVKRRTELTAALANAFQYDRKVLIEAACQGREFECSVLGNERPECSVPGEVIVRGGHEFYSYDSKYVDPEGSETRVPAELPRAVSKRLRDLSAAAFKLLSLRGMARVDFLARADLSEIFINEVNTIPGFTSISMYPKLWEASGLPLPRLIDRLVDLALEHHRAQARLRYTYQPKAT
ncbi:MAG: D-alanine--D-alanine ligase family protein, partial [Candidatus Binataceae bacterium]